MHILTFILSPLYYILPILTFILSPLYYILPILTFILSPLYYILPCWGCSSDGRAFAQHARGTGIDTPHLHFYILSILIPSLCTIILFTSNLYVISLYLYIYISIYVPFLYFLYILYIYISIYVPFLCAFLYLLFYIK